MHPTFRSKQIHKQKLKTGKIISVWDMNFDVMDKEVVKQINKIWGVETDEETSRIAHYRFPGKIIAHAPEVPDEAAEEAEETKTS